MIIGERDGSPYDSEFYAPCGRLWGTENTCFGVYMELQEVGIFGNATDMDEDYLVSTVSLQAHWTHGVFNPNDGG